MTDSLTPKEIFEHMAEYFEPDKAKGLEATFQYNLTGPNGGTWHIVIKDQTCTVASGPAESPTTTFTMSAETFIKISMGDTNPMMAFSLGKLKIHGDPIKAASLTKLFRKP